VADEVENYSMLRTFMELNFFLMKIKHVFFAFLFSILNLVKISGQDVYTVTSGEMIFSWANLELKNSYQTAFSGAKIVDTPPRFTVFFHLAQYLHTDFNNNSGIFTGLSIRNVGFISDEVLPTILNPSLPQDYQDYKIIRRLYTLGIPLAIKLGSFKDHVYFFGGAEMEWGFHMKEKWWNQHKRSGTKSKRTQWFPNNTEAFIPSVFGGVQFPKGLNVKFKYYLNDFINRNYDGNGLPTDVSNLTRYKASQTMYLSFSWQFRHQFKKRDSRETLF
jgi:hypothetical protein